MRVDPTYTSNLVSSLDQVVANEQTYSQELSSGIRLTSLSDDPAAAGDNVALSSEIAQDSAFEQSASTTESMLQVGDSALGAVVTQLTSAISLATEANNGTLNSSNIQGIANQLSGIRDEVFSLANSAYLGSYIFAGSQGKSAPFVMNSSSSPAVATYIGDNTANYLETPTGQKIQISFSGGQIFSRAGADVLNTLNSLVADFSSGTPSPTSVSDTEALTTVLNHVGQQRVLLDNSITQLKSASGYAQTESTQLESAQNTLLQADYATVSTQLSAAETQQTAISDVLSVLEKGSLFDYISQ